MAEFIINGFKAEAAMSTEFAGAYIVDASKVGIAGTFPPSMVVEKNGVYAHFWLTAFALRHDRSIGSALYQDAGFTVVVRNDGAVSEMK